MQAAGNDAEVPGCDAEAEGGGEMSDAINHPTYYGGDTTYETIKVIEAWGLGFRLRGEVHFAGGKESEPVRRSEKGALVSRSRDRTTGGTGCSTEVQGGRGICSGRVTEHAIADCARSADVGMRRGGTISAGGIRGVRRVRNPLVSGGL